MGATIWIKSAKAEEELADDLSVICLKMRLLDKACKRDGAVTWSELQDNSVMAAEFGEDLEPNLVNPAILLNTITASRKAISDGSIRIDGSLLTRLNDELTIAESIVETCYGKGELVRVILVP